MAFPLSRARKRLTGAGAGPDGSGVGPAGETEGMRPASNPGEEVALAISDEVVSADIDDAAIVNIAGRNERCPDEVFEPAGGIRLILVVIGGHVFPSSAVAWPVAVSERGVKYISPLFFLITASLRVSFRWPCRYSDVDDRGNHSTTSISHLDDTRRYVGSTITSNPRRLRRSFIRSASLVAAAARLGGASASRRGLGNLGVVLAVGRDTA